MKGSLRRSASLGIDWDKFMAGVVPEHEPDTNIEFGQLFDRWHLANQGEADNWMAVHRTDKESLCNKFIDQMATYFASKKGAFYATNRPDEFGNRHKRNLAALDMYIFRAEYYGPAIRRAVSTWPDRPHKRQRLVEQEADPDYVFDENEQDSDSDSDSDGDMDYDEMYDCTEDEMEELEEIDDTASVTSVDTEAAASVASTVQNQASLSLTCGQPLSFKRIGNNVHTGISLSTPTMPMQYWSLNEHGDLLNKEAWTKRPHIPRTAAHAYQSVVLAPTKNSQPWLAQLRQCIDAWQAEFSARYQIHKHYPCLSNSGKICFSKPLVTIPTSMDAFLSYVPLTPPLRDAWNQKVPLAYEEVPVTADSSSALSSVQRYSVKRHTLMQVVFEPVFKIYGKQTFRLMLYPTLVQLHDSRGYSHGHESVVGLSTLANVAAGRSVSESTQHLGPHVAASTLDTRVSSEPITPTVTLQRSTMPQVQIHERMNRQVDWAEAIITSSHVEIPSYLDANMLACSIESHIYHHMGSCVDKYKSAVQLVAAAMQGDASIVARVVQNTRSEVEQILGTIRH